MASISTDRSGNRRIFFSGPNRNMTLATFIDQYIAARMITKPNTLRNYHGTKRLLLDFFGERLLADITPGDCDDWRVHRLGRGGPRQPSAGR